MGWIFLFLIIAIIVVAIIFYTSTYNELVKRKNKVKNSWAHIEAQLQRRFDLIPNLVDILKGFMSHEKQIVENVANSLSTYTNAHNNQEKIAANEQLTAYLKSLFVIADGYPQLKSNANFLQLQSALTEIEEDISYARQFYNDAVTIYNNKLMMFPNNIIASKCGFKEETLFDAVAAADVAPTIQLQTSKYIKCPVCGATITNQSLTNCEYCGCSLV